MSQGKNKLIAAHVRRVPPGESWWSATLRRLGGRKARRYEETLERLAQRDVTDTVAEEDVKAWLAMIEAEDAAAAAGPDRPPGKRSG